MTPQELCEYIDRRLDERLPTQVPKYWPASVISVGNGSAVVHLPTDPDGVNITVQNPREIPLEVNDEVNLVAINGSLSNAIIDFRKGITLSTIYVDYATGVDDYKHGTESAPFQTLQYAINRLPKNLNGRNVYVYFKNLNEQDIYIDKFYGGRFIKISPYDGSTSQTVNSIIINDCMVGIDIYYLNISGKNPSYNNNAVFAFNNYYVLFDHCNASCATYDGSSSGFVASYGTNMTISNSIVSNRGNGIYAGYMSNIYSYKNSGTNNNVALTSVRSSIIGKDDTQPSGSTAEYSTPDSSIIGNTTLLDSIYVDNTTGVDDYQHGTSGAPFKTLNYAISRLPKNLNSRNVNIYFNTLSSAENVGFNNFYGGGSITVQPLSGTSLKNINTLTFVGCTGCKIETKYLNCINTSGSCVQIYRSNIIYLTNCGMSTASSYNGVEVFDGAHAFIQNCNISNRANGILASCSTVMSINNSSTSGTNSGYGLFSQYAAVIGKSSTQPTGATGNEGITSGGDIR
jgi:hypothetical protein